MPVSGVALGDRSSSVMSEIDVMHEAWVMMAPYYISV